MIHDSSTASLLNQEGATRPHITALRRDAPVTRKISATLILWLILVSAAPAEQRLGIAVYPGAVYDPVRTKLLANNPTMEGAAFRTADDIEKVRDFYRKQGLVLLKFGSTSNERVRFKNMETDTDVVIQQPWQDPQSKAIMKDTLILILRGREQ